MSVKDVSSLCVVDYSLETLELRWITPREKAVEFDPGGKDDSQFIINDFVLTNCSSNATDGLLSSFLSIIDCTHTHNALAQCQLRRAKVH